MPLFQGTELEDGRYLGLTVWEVTALSHVDVFGPDTGRMGISSRVCWGIWPGCAGSPRRWSFSGCPSR